MEATFIRGFVLMLALTGFGASTVTSAQKPATATTAADGVNTLPTCPYNDPNACGLD
jgi:hypothetical protein